MKKFFAALSFVAGGVFALFFSSKKGEQLRKEVQSEKTSDGKIEVVAREAKTVLSNFWNMIKDPLKKGAMKIEQEAEKYGKKYGGEAKEKMGEWKDKAVTEMSKELKKAKKKAWKLEAKLAKKLKR